MRFRNKGQHVDLCLQFYIFESQYLDNYALDQHEI